VEHLKLSKPIWKVKSKFPNEKRDGANVNSAKFDCRKPLSDLKRSKQLSFVAKNRRLLERVSETEGREPSRREMKSLKLVMTEASPISLNIEFSWSLSSMRISKHSPVKTKYSVRIGEMKEIFELGRENVCPQTVKLNHSSPAGRGTCLSDSEVSFMVTVSMTLKMIPIKIFVFFSKFETNQKLK
jgi:hypothetical protein